MEFLTYLTGGARVTTFGAVGHSAIPGAKATFASRLGIVPRTVRSLIVKRMIIAVLFACIAGVAVAQTAPLPQYKVLKSSTAKNAASEWNAAADQGYRFLFEGRLAVMHLEATAPDTYRYAALPDRNLRDTFLNALNQQGAFGYAWINGTHMLEKLPHPHVYEYAIVEGFAAGTRHTSHDSLIAQAFAPVGRFGSVPIYVRDTTIDSPATSPQSVTRFIDRLNPGKTFKQISALAAQSYRYRSDELTDSGTRIAMDLCDNACGGPFEYRRFEGKDAAQIEKTLNDFASDGYRIVRASLDWEPYLVERPARHPVSSPATFSYRVSEAKDAATIEQFLNTTAQDGFVPVGFLAHIGWTASIFIVVERPPASPPH